VPVTIKTENVTRASTVGTSGNVVPSLMSSGVPPSSTQNLPMSSVKTSTTGTGGITTETKVN